MMSLMGMFGTVVQGHGSVWDIIRDILTRLLQGPGEGSQPSAQVMSPHATAEQHRSSVQIPRFRPECQGKTQVKSQDSTWT